MTGTTNIYYIWYGDWSGNTAPTNYSLGKSLSDAQIKTVVSSAITSGRLQLDASGIYFVLTSQDVMASSGFCTQYCGWHTHTTISGTDIKYSFVGNGARCLSSCAAQLLERAKNHVVYCAKSY